MRILVTGSRHYANRSKIKSAIEIAMAVSPDKAIIVHGDAPGADTLAKQFAIERGLEHEAHPADWSLGRKAGPLRNQTMVDLGADICLAFPLDDSRGTWDCVKRAHAAGIPIFLN